MTKDKALALLSDETDIWLLAGIARHKDTPPDALVKLAQHPTPMVYARAIQHPSMPFDALVEMAQGEETGRWVAIVKTKRLPLDLVLDMAQRTSLIEVAHTCLDDYDLTPEVQLGLTEIEIWRHALSQSDKTAPQVLIHLASDSNSDIRWQVARDERTPIETLMLLAQDEDSDVEAEARNNLDSKDLFDILGD